MLNFELLEFFNQRFVFVFEVAEPQVLVFVPLQQLLGLQSEVFELHELSGLHHAASLVFPKHLEVFGFILQQHPQLHTFLRTHFASKQQQSRLDQLQYLSHSLVLGLVGGCYRLDYEFKLLFGQRKRVG